MNVTTANGAPAPAYSPPKILIVDDDALIGVTLASALRHAGYEVSNVTSPLGALDLCAMHHFDLAILDQQMPEMSGSALASELQRAYGLSSIFLSAYSNDEFVEQAISAGAISYLLKPVDPPNLIPAVRTALSRVMELRSLKERDSQMRSIMESKRIVSTAVGLLMERLQITQTAAFDLLRQYARSQRSRLIVVAEALLKSSDDKNRLTMAIAALARATSKKKDEGGKKH